MKTHLRSIIQSLPLLFALAFAITVTFSAGKALAETRTFHEVAVEINGSKLWLPATLVVKKGDLVKIHAISKIPGANSVHGFAIDAFKIQEVIDTKGKEFSFTADKAGIFPLHCQMHPAHIGGQLIVLE